MPDTDPTSPWPAPSAPPTGGRSAGGTAADAVPSTPTASPARRWVTVGGLGAGLLGGVAAGLVLGVPGLSGASGAPSLGGPIPAQSDEQQPADSGADDASSQADDTDREERADELRTERTERIRENLQSLVDDGTLDADQADAVAEHLAAELPSRSSGGDHGPGPIGRALDGERGERITERLTGRAERLERLAEVLDLGRDDLVDRLRDGESLAEIAETQGVDPDELVDVLIAERVERIDDAVADGDLDPDEADERKAALEEMATAHVDGEHPAGPHGRWRPGDPDDGPADEVPPADEPADDSAD